jgi:aminopeptidase N
MNKIRSGHVGMNGCGYEKKKMKQISGMPARPCRWDAAQRLAKKLLLSLYAAAREANSSVENVEDALIAAGGVSEGLIKAYRSILLDETIDGSTAAMSLTMPSQSELVQAIDEADPVLVHAVRRFAVRSIAQPLAGELTAVRCCPQSMPQIPPEGGCVQHLHQ